MNTLWPSDKTIVTRLRVKCAGVDALAAQLRVASLLNAANLRPAGIPPSAIVCIHRLRDPLPGLLQLSDSGSRPQHQWEQAVIAALERMVRQAARPALGVVPANAEAVIFSDRAELLACLASDWCAGIAVTRWWWQSLFRGVDVAPTVLAAWREAPEYIPAALQHLAETGRVAPFIRALNDNNARTLLQRLTHRFALTALQQALAVVEEHIGPITEQETTLPQTQTAAASLPQSSPWRRWVPESESSGLTLAQQSLLGIGLMLRRAPAVVRTPAFARAVLAWHRAGFAIENNLAKKVAAAAMETHDFQREIFPASPMAQARPPDRWEKLSRFTTEEDHQLEENRTSIAAGAPSTGKMKIAGFEQAHELKQNAPPAAVHETKPGIAQTYDAAGWREAASETKYGGVFYFINLGLFLNLYADFTAPLQPGIALSIWDFVALLGEQLVGEKIKADPVWPLLARLAGRNEQEEPGQDFTPPDHWRLPPEWLAPFPEAGVWEWTVEDRRLRVKHPEKFLVLDLPLEAGDPLQQLQDEMQVYTDVVAFDLRSALFSNMPFWKNLFQHEQRAHFKEDSSEMTSNLEFAPLRRWLSWLMPYVRARLHRALGLPPTADLAKILCEHHARLFATATHLDIELSLADLPIAIRLSGLDRNPGWVPAAGRFVDFRFTIAD